MNRLTKVLARLKETADEVDKVTLDVPLLIRMLEFAREDAKDDMAIHSAVENMLNIQNSGIAILGMEDYEDIVGGVETKEVAAALDPYSILGECVNNLGKINGEVNGVRHKVKNKKVQQILSESLQHINRAEIMLRDAMDKEHPLHC